MVQERPSLSLLAVSLPLMFAETSEIVIHLIDTLFLGRIGPVALGAIGIADTILEISVVVAVGIVEAVQIVVARRLGENRLQAIGDVFDQGLILVGGTSVVLGAALFAGASWLGDVFTGSEEVAAAVTSYLRIAAFTVPLFGLSFLYSGLYIGLGRTKTLAWATACLAITNLLLGYGLILGELGLPRLGIRGAALASLGAEIVTVAFLTGAALRLPDRGAIGLLRRPRWDRGVASSLSIMAAPVALEVLVESAQWLVFFAIAAHVGVSVLAWTNVVYTCLMVLLIPTGGLGEVVVSYVSRMLGRQRAEDGMVIVERAIGIGYAVTLPFAAALVVFPKPVLSLFTSDPATIEGAAGGLMVVGAAMLLVVPGELWWSAVVATGDTPGSLFIGTVVAAVMVGLAFLAVRLDLGSTYVWLAVPGSWAVGLALAREWMRRGWWKERALASDA